MLVTYTVVVVVVVTVDCCCCYSFIPLRCCWLFVVVTYVICCCCCSIACYCCYRLIYVYVAIYVCLPLCDFVVVVGYQLPYVCLCPVVRCPLHLRSRYFGSPVRPTFFAFAFALPLRLPRAPLLRGCIARLHLCLVPVVVRYVWLYHPVGCLVPSLHAFHLQFCTRVATFTFYVWFTYVTFTRSVPGCYPFGYLCLPFPRVPFAFAFAPLPCPVLRYICPAPLPTPPAFTLVAHCPARSPLRVGLRLPAHLRCAHTVAFCLLRVARSFGLPWFSLPFVVARVAPCLILFWLQLQLPCSLQLRFTTFVAFIYVVHLPLQFIYVTFILQLFICSYLTPLPLPQLLSLFTVTFTFYSYVPHLLPVPQFTFYVG